jgi:hypothetical protein
MMNLKETMLLTSLIALVYRFFFWENLVYRNYNQEILYDSSEQSSESILVYFTISFYLISKLAMVTPAVYKLTRIHKLII